MDGSTLGNAIYKLSDQVSVELGDTPALRREAYRLRYQVYCVEREYEAGQDGLECDNYDDSARHAMIRCRQTGDVIGTVRLVLPKGRAGDDDFPVQHVCDPALLSALPRATIGEVSRFALPKDRGT